MKRQMRRVWYDDQARRSRLKRHHPSQPSEERDMIDQAYIRSKGFLYPILSDTGVFPSGEGYERSLLIAEWNPNDMNQLAQIHLRVDRQPANSFAKVGVWSKTGGWNAVVILPPSEYWGTMPGYTRYGQDKTTVLTAQLASDLIQDLVDIVHNPGL